MIVPIRPSRRRWGNAGFLFDPRKRRVRDGSIVDDGTDSSVTSGTESTSGDEFSASFSSEDNKNCSYQQHVRDRVKVLRFHPDVTEHPPVASREEITGLWIRKRDLTLARRRAVRDSLLCQQEPECREAIETLKGKLPYMVVDTDEWEEAHEEEDPSSIEDDDIMEKLKEAALHVFIKQEKSRGLERYALGLGKRKEIVFVVLETQEMLRCVSFEERAIAIAEASASVSKSAFDWARSLGLADEKEASNVFATADDDDEEEAEFVPHSTIRLSHSGRIIQSVEL